MRGASKTLIAALAVLALAFGLAACGGGDDSNSTEAASQAQAEGKANGTGSSQGEPSEAGGGENSSSGGEGEGKPGSSGGGSSGSGDSATDFVPKHHKDAGGGSKQFEVKGGDNSVQEYGDEADTSELNAAAVVLHDFLDARAQGNWAAACEYLAKSTTSAFEKLAAQAKQLEDTSCAGILEKLMNPAAKQSMEEEAAKANVGSLRIEGERAFVIYTGIDGTVIAMPMTNEGGVWKVASLSGTPLS